MRTPCPSARRRSVNDIGAGDMAWIGNVPSEFARSASSFSSPQFVPIRPLEELDPRFHHFLGDAERQSRLRVSPCQAPQ